MSNEPPLEYYWKDFMLNGSRDSYRSLYRHYFAYLYYIGIKRKYSAEAVKDTINDVFLYIWEKRKSLQHIRSPHNYLVTAFFRKMAKEKGTPELLISDLSVEESFFSESFNAPSFEQTLLTRETNDRLSQLLKRHLNELPVRQREILFQKFFLGLSYAEIAGANRVSVNTVYNTIYTTIRKLRSSIPAGTVSNIVSLCFAAVIIFS